ncbi:MAG: hypothetical protein JO131_00625 [Gammaproteobacteria bacterium]|nr:hypothetical protein [Gammaproteobacteria bacterium]
MNKTLQKSQTFPSSIKRISVVQSLLVVSFFWGLGLYLLGKHITGPFIFGDEETYFSFARTIARGENINTYTQYGPLYPALIAPFFSLKSIIQSYSVMKIFNVIVFISTVIPAYLLGKDLLKNYYLKALLPTLVIISPYGAFVYLIWAEPLYIPLFYWVCFLLYRHCEIPSLANSLFLGLFLSLLYFTKPIAGFVAYIAIMLTFSFYILFNFRLLSRKIKLFALLTLLTCSLLNFIWILHYLHLGVSIVGYPSANKELQLKIEHLGYWHQAYAITRSIFYQFSYFFIGSWGLIGILFIMFITQQHHLKFSEKNLVLFIFLYIAGVILISAMGMSSYRGLDHKMAQGRYYSLVLPLIITLTLHFVFSCKSVRIKPLLYILVITSIVSIIASPLYTRSPVAYTSMPELAPFIYISDKGLSVWRATVEKPSFPLRIYSILFFTVFTCLLLGIRRWKYTPLLATNIIFLGTLFNSITEQYYVLIIGKSQAGLNNIYRYLIKEHINIATVAFDKRMSPGNPAFLTPFWLEGIANYAKIEDFIKISTPATFTYFITWDKLNKHSAYTSGGMTIYTARTP